MQRQLPFFFLLTLTTAFGVNSCQNRSIPEENNSDLPGEGVTVTPTYVSLEERFQTEIVNIGLEKLGYEIGKMRELEPALMHTDLAEGGLDYTAAHWQQLGRKFYENSGGDQKLEKVGVIVDNAVQGYLIDHATAQKYEITNLEQLQDPEIAKIFDTDGDGKANLVGCNAGWGCETIINHHLESYDLNATVEHESGKYFALMADVMARYRQDKPILYYTWTPLWTSSVLVPGQDVQWLEVPYTSLPETSTSSANPDTTYQGKNLGFVTDKIMILANETFAQSHPSAIALMEQVQIPIADVSAQNQRLREGEDSPSDIRRHAQTWVKEHEETFQQWLDNAQSKSGDGETGRQGTPMMIND
ncbi:MAG: glycine betaine/L-proline ABC transporter substrate-binding protein ProX [Halothece sp. Uz-M2-17]|nr:glycine betaine/L-proline ABC transporter substrate-binding protein ProX [Halothece sp. Uz-M2-17]